MSEIWKKIFKEYIESYEAIKILKRNHVIDDDFYGELNTDLLEDIIATFKSEVED